MTAIVGIIRFDGAIAPDCLLRCMGVLARYGADRQRQWSRTNAALGSTLLRLTPEDAFDRQPLVSPDGTKVLVFSGRIDNRSELASALAIPSARAKFMADSAFVLLAYERWGENCLSQLHGDFAFALWEPRSRRLFLARDPLGKRPLYWHKGKGLFAFASTPAALLALPEVPSAIDEERLADFLALLPWVGPQTLYQGIQRIEPGHYLLLEEDRVRPQRYHRLDVERCIELPRDEDYVEAFRAHFEAAVRCRLRSTGPVGTELSSGFDSSTVTAIAAQLLAARGQGLTAFTATPRPGFAGPVPRDRHADEAPGAAALVARHTNIEHVLVSGDGRPLDFMDLYVEAGGRPSLNSCNCTWAKPLVDQAKRRGIKVLLGGSLGNMGLSYDGLPLLPGLLSQGKWWRWGREAYALHRAGVMSWKAILGKSLGAFMPSFLWRTLKGQSLQQDNLYAHSAIHPEFAKEMRIRERARAGDLDLDYRPRRDGRALRIMALQRFDLGDYHLLPLALAGVEQRNPTEDLRFLEFCLAIPEEQYLRHGQTRWLLRRAFGHLLPPEILGARTRGLQAADWFEGATAQRERMAEEVERLSASPAAARCLDLESLRTLIAEWPTAGWESQPVISAYRAKLLRGLAVGSFIRYVEGGNS